MSKTAIIIRTITSIIIFAFSVFLIYNLFLFIRTVNNVEYGGLAVFGLIAYFIYAIPVVLMVLLYQIVMLVKKKVFLLELIASIIFILSWISLILVPAVM